MPLHLGTFGFPWGKDVHRGHETSGLGAFLGGESLQLQPGCWWESCVLRVCMCWGLLHTRSRPLPLLLAGAILLDLEQTTLPGIAHLMVETMIISDQIRAEDRANVLRALLLKHRWVVRGWGLSGSPRWQGRQVPSRPPFSPSATPMMKKKASSRGTTPAPA